MEAVFRVKQGSMYEILSKMEDRISSMGKKLTNKRRLNIQLLTEFVRFKLQVWETQGDSANLTHLLNSIDVSRMRSVYKAIALREFRSAAKVNLSDTMSVLHCKVFPLMVRDVPFVLLQKVAQQAFDIDLFPEDEDRFRASELNSHIPPSWFTENPIHKWGENHLKSHSSSLPSQVDHLPDYMHVSFSQSLAVSYEAPWVMPAIAGKEHLRQSSSGSCRRRPSLVVPARALKMEGRRQSYKPSPSDGEVFTEIDDGAGTLCVIPNQTEDGFTISRGVLDAMRDWQHEETQPTKPGIRGGFNDVLEDLFHSPSQPCTRVPTPVKSPRKRSARGTPVSTKRMKKTASPTLPPSENTNPNHSKYNSVEGSIIGSLLLDSGSTSPPCTSNPARLLRAPGITQSERAIRKHIRDMDDYHKLNIF